MGAVLATTLGLSDPASVVQRQLDTYNAQDLAGFLGTYSDDVVIADVGGEVTSRGRAALEKRYSDLFKTYPHNHADVAHRIVIGDKVVDHERVMRDGKNLAFEALAIYTVREGQIVRVDFVK
jgi:uncharacterized protein (TIGR02246 family)